MKFLKLIQSETEIDKSLEYDVLYYNNTSAKITVSETNPITSTTYEVKNVSNPTSLPYDATSMVVSFTGVKTETYKKGQVDVTETSETETVSFEANTSSASTATREGSFTWNEQSVAWSTTLGVAPAINITMQDSYTDTDIIALSAEKSASVEGNITWTCNLASSIAEINGSTLQFKKHYEGSVTLTATASNASAEKTITVTCDEVATGYTYSVSNVSSPTVEWNETSATITFTGIITAHYVLKADENTSTQEYQVVTFEQNKPQGDNPMDLSNPNLEYVNLGLPSGLLWAKCNLGAISETGYGAYFSWGDTVGYARPYMKGGSSAIRNIESSFTWNDVEVNYTVKQGGANGSGFSWATEKWNGGASSYDETYFASVSSTVCPNGVLAAEHDAARVHMGDKWRMPSYAEIRELTANTGTIWYDNGNTEFNGIPGMKFVSYKDESKYIFIPASGYFNGTSHMDDDVKCHLWASTLTSTGYNAECMSIDRRLASTGMGLRYYGFVIRGVKSKA